MLRKLGRVAVLSGLLLQGLWWGTQIGAQPADSVVATLEIGSSTSILTGLSNVGAAVLVDLDRDGQLDLAYSEGSAVRIARNTVGIAGEWDTTWHVGTASGTVTHLAPGDLNGDGRPDLVSVAGDEIRIWQNPATPENPGETFAGTWTMEATLSVPGGISQSALTLSDLDSDGARDIATGGADGVVHLWQNPGGGGWSVRQALPPLVGPVRDLAVDDLDHDSHPDLVVVSGGIDSMVRLWRNPGDAFSASWDTSQDLAAAGLDIQGETLSVTNLNDDHRPDVVVGDAGGVIYVWEQPAANPFGVTWGGQQIANAENSISNLITVDLGRDAGTELVVVEESIPVRLETWKFTACSGQWEMTLVDQSDSALLGLSAGDLDHDGDLDVVAASPGEVLAWENVFPQAVVQFDTTGQSVGAIEPEHIISDLIQADLDNDGDMDLVSGERLGQIVAWRNDGQPFESGWESFTIGYGAQLVGDMAAGDMDNDGDLDIVVGLRNTAIVIWENNGTLTGWTYWVIGNESAPVNALEVADIDGDGLLDVVTGGGSPSWSVPPTPDNRVTVWLHGPLNETWPAIDVGEAYYVVRSIALGDLDIDGDVDIVIGTNHAPPEGSVENPVPRDEWADVYQIRAFRNDGTTSWYEINVGRDPEFETLSPPTGLYHGFWGANISSVSLADLDNDGDLDIVSTDHMEGDFQVMGWENDGTPFSGAEELWRGCAISVGPYHNWLFSSVYASDTGDFDGDGDIDVATANAYAETGQAEIMLWENTGIAFHEVVSQTHWARHDIGEFAVAVDAVAVRAADFDMDGDLDLASAAYTDTVPYAIMVWENTTNRAPDAPACPLPSLGEVDVPVTSTLAWGGSDPDGDALVYTVALGTSDPPPVVATSLTTSAFDPGPLQGDTTYYWQITATDGSSATSGPMWQFTTTQDHGPAISIELAPDPETVTAGDSVTYQAMAEDDQSNTWDVTAGTTFSIEVGAGGSWTDNVYTSQNPGTWTVTGEFESLSDTAILTTVTSGPETHSIPLQPGWNLVSFRLQPVSTIITDVLSSINGNYDLVYAWDAPSQQWLSCDNIPLSPDSLHNLDEKMGFWINATTTVTLDVAGNVPTTTDINLHSTGAGWNLVGYPSAVNGDLPGVLEDHGVGTDFSLVYAYHADDTTDPWKLFDRVAWGLGFPQDLTDLSAGWGYWVRVNVDDHTWNVVYEP
jgi:hypothetical protein